ncbi:hypothetical protein ACF0H5_000579 [Mactra antiquata]
MELSNIMKGTICIIVLLNMVAVNKSHSGVDRRRFPTVQNANYLNFLPGSFCIPCGSNNECVQRLGYCNETCECTGCEDELYCGDLTRRNTRLFEARCDVQLIQVTSTQKKTETLKSTVTSTLTRTTTKVGTAILSSMFRLIGLASFVDFPLSIDLLNGNIIPVGSTACFVATANATATDGLSFRIGPTVSAAVSVLTLTGSCTATTFFPVQG